MFENLGYYLEGFKNFYETGDVLSKKERMLLDWCNYLLDNTKFKNIVLNRFNDITFESSNRLFQLEIDDNKLYKLTYIYRSGNKYDNSKGQINGDFYNLRNWFKKRNYLK